MSERRERRRRFAVALVVPPPAAIEIDALRRALGDRQLGRIDPHITVVPPINLRDDDIADAMAVLEAAARRCAPCELTLGPVESFAPEGRARFLRVAPWAPVVAVHDACWTGPFDRPERRSYHPHVTIDIEGHDGDPPDPAIDLLAGYAVETRIDHLTLLEHHPGDDEAGTGRNAERRWDPFVHHRLTG